MRSGQRSERRSRGSARRLREVAAAWTLALPVAASVLAVGAVHAPVLFGVALLVLAAAVQCALLLGQERQEPRGDGPRSTPVPASAPRRAIRALFAAPSPALIAAALAAFCLLQAAPLPMGLLERIAPANADVWARALLPLGEAPPRLASVSLDPGASIIQALQWATYAGVFFAASAVAARRGAAWGVAVVFCSALAAALTTLGHGLAGATHVFGLYAPQFAAAPWHIGPLLNPNNLAGYLNLGAFCGVGLYITRRPILPRWLVGVGVAIIVAVTVTSASRGGLGVLPLGAAVIGFLIWRRGVRRDRAEGSAPGVLKGLVAVALGGGVTLALLGSSSMTWTELGDRNVSKLHLFRSILPMLRDHIWLGVGRGAFESAYPAYRVAPGNVVFTHAENFPLQWACEWGAPAALLALAAFARGMRPGRLGVPRSAVAIGAWTGALVLLAQNLVDLALEVPAVPIALAMALGSVWGDARRRGLAPRDASSGASGASGLTGPSARLAVLRAVAIGLAGALLLGAAARFGAPDLDADRAAARTALEAATRAGQKRGEPGAEPGAGEALRQALRGAMSRHPADPYFPLVGALGAWQSGRESPIPWLQRSLERSQQNGRAHLLLAEVLASRGARPQALLELRLAAEDDPDLVTPAAQNALRWTRSYDELERAVPEGELGARMLGVMARRLFRRGEEQVRLRCAREAIRRDPGALDARWVVADTLLAAIAEDRPPGLCTGELRAACADEIEEHARAIDAGERGSYLAADLRARWHMLDGRAAKAEEMLAEVCNRVPERTACLRLRVRAAAETGIPARLVSASKDLLGEACGPGPSCAESATWLGDLMAGRKAWGTAIGHYERAIAAEPTEERWQKLAEAAVGAGSYVRAVEALERVLRARGGKDPALEQRIAALRARAASRLIDR